MGLGAGVFFTKFLRTINSLNAGHVWGGGLFTLSAGVFFWDFSSWPSGREGGEAGIFLRTPVTSVLRQSAYFTFFLTLTYELPRCEKDS